MTLYGRKHAPASNGTSLMSRDTRMYLQDMLECCHRILDFTWDIVENKIPSLERDLKSFLNTT